MSLEKTMKDLVTAAVGGVNHTLGVVASAPATSPGPQLRKDVQPVLEIGAVVGVIGAGFQGSMVLGFPMSTYLKVMSRMFGTEYTELNEDIQDGVAELCNMVLGAIKTAMNANGYAVQQAIPTVIRGQNLQVLTSGGSQPSVIIPFKCELGDFYAELTISPKSAERKAAA